MRITMIRRVTIMVLVVWAMLVTSFAADKVESQNIAGWGQPADPDGDCKISLDQGRLKIAIPGTDHALATERAKTNAPRVLQQVEGDFEGTVKVSADALRSGASVVSTRRAFQGAGLVLWQDAGNYIRLERAQLVVNEQTMNYVSFELRREGQFVKSGNAGEYPLKGTNTWLRLNRRGDRVTAFVSEDGKGWDALKTFQVDFGKELQVGVLAGHNTSTPVTATFEDFLIQPFGKSDKPK